MFSAGQIDDSEMLILRGRVSPVLYRSYQSTVESNHSLQTFSQVRLRHSFFLCSSIYMLEREEGVLVVLNVEVGLFDRL